MALEVKSRFVRRGAPKVKTGCITCRRRKVKCGEEKPGCQRCLNFGILCDGYKPPRSKRAEKEARLLALIPKPVPIVPKQSLVPPPTTNLFKNDLEYRYFQRFCQESALQLTGHLDSNLWNQVILQTSESEPCIRNAVAAIGALNFNSLSSEYEGIDKLHFAYRAYGQAIVQLKASIEKGQASIRTKLLACLLFACFEFYHGNNDIASAQILSGVDMMRAYTKSHSQDRGTGSALPLPNPEEIDADIADALGVLEISSSSYSDPRSTQLHLDRMQCDQSLVDNIPSEFKNLKAARPTLLAIMLRALHYVLACRKSNVPDTFNMFAHVDPSYSQLCKYFDELHRWHKAFQPLLDKARNERSKCEHRFRKATYQEIHYLSYYLYLASAGPWQMYYTRYTKELAEIIRLVKVLLEPSKNDAGIAKYNSTYSLNLRLVMPLNAVGLPYRHRALRKEAIDILASMNAKRDGAFDARITSKIMQWMADLEEESDLGDAEYVPYYLAAKVVKMRVDVQANKAFVVVKLPRRGDPSKSDMKEATIYGGDG